MLLHQAGSNPRQLGVGIWRLALEEACPLLPKAFDDNLHPAFLAEFCAQLRLKVSPHKDCLFVARCQQIITSFPVKLRSRNAHTHRPQVPQGVTV